MVLYSSFRFITPWINLVWDNSPLESIRWREWRWIFYPTARGRREERRAERAERAGRGRRGRRVVVPVDATKEVEALFLTERRSNHSAPPTSTWLRLHPLHPALAASSTRCLDHPPVDSGRIFKPPNVYFTPIFMLSRQHVVAITNSTVLFIPLKIYTRENLSSHKNTK